MKSFLFCLCMLQLVRSSHGQQPPPVISRAPLPAGPLLNEAPAYSHWNVTVKTATKTPLRPVASSADPHQKDAPVPRQLDVTKTGRIRHVVGTNSDGINEQLWLEGTLETIIVPTLKTPVIMDTHDGLDPYYTQFVYTDFPGLHWISARNYVGVTKVAERDCLVFQDTVPVDGPREDVAASPPVAAIACIDLETRLPVYMKKGPDESAYEFAAAPTDALVLPPEVTEALIARAQRIQRLTRPPARPY